MKVLIVGSWPGKQGTSSTSRTPGAPNFPVSANDSSPSHEEFVHACQAVGIALASDGHEIIVGSDTEDSADRYVVLAAAAQAAKNHRVVRCWYVPRHSPGRQPFSNDGAPPAGLEVILVNPRRSDWESATVRQVEMADGVLTIGGRRRTRTAAYLAMAQRKPVAAVPWMGGAGREIADDLKVSFGDDPETSQRLGRLEVAALAPAESTALAAAEAVHLLPQLAPRPEGRASRIPAGVLPLAVVALAAWGALFSGPWPDGAVLYFLLSATAALAGTVLRNALRVVFDPTADLTWSRLYFDGVAGLLLGFLLFLMYLAGALLLTGDDAPALPPRDDGAFLKVAVLVSLFGTAGGLMIEEAADRLRKFLVDRLQTPA